MTMGLRALGPNAANGQAMVEFAILVLVVTLLIAGGIELATAAFSGQRTSDGSRAAADTWIHAVGSAGVYDEELGPVFEIDDSPLGGGSILGAGRVGLGDHNGPFGRPACDPGDPALYDDGLPADSVTAAAGDQTAVYLFNPLPIDITSCVGADGTDPNRTRLSVLIDRLPALNQAMYSLYQRHCADAAGNEISCSDAANVAATYLRLPGKLDPLTDTVSLAMLDGDPDSPTFQLPLPDSPRPAFDIECAEPGPDIFLACDSAALPGGVCWADADTPIACDVRVRTRYRSVFHALLQYPFVYWSVPLPPEALEQMDLGPAGSSIGVVGSEVARGNVRRLQRTFLGCWETVTIAPSAGMLGQRTTRACS
jgi:hypothetical protein